MLSFFKSNNPGVVVGYFVYLFLFRICWFFSQPDTSFIEQHQEPLSQLFFSLLKSANMYNGWPLIVLGGIMQFIQALLVNSIVNENKITVKKNYAVGLCFIILSSFFKDSLLLSPASLSLTFALLSLRSTLPLIKKEKSYGDVFDIGFFAATAFLFYFPSILLILFAYIGLSTVRPFIAREWLALLLGIIAPIFACFVFYFWNDCLANFPLHLFNLPFNQNFSSLAFGLFDWVGVGSLSLIFIASAFLLPGILYSSLIQIRKFTGLFVVLVFFFIGGFFLQAHFHRSYMQLFALPMSFLVGMALVSIKSEVVSEVIHLILILFATALSIVPLFITI